MFSMKMTLGLVALYKGGGSSGGGGGSSGKVSWPSYLQDIHKDLLNHDGDTDLNDGVSAYDALNSVWYNSPYSGAFTYDPTDNLAQAQARLDNFTTYVDGINAALYDTYFAQVAATVSTAFGTDYITAQVDAQEARLLGPTMRAISRMSSGARDINATLSSSYIQQVAYIERTFLQDLAEFSGKLAMAVNAQRIDMTTAGIGHLLSLLQMRGANEQVAAQYTIELNRISIVAQKEFIEGDNELAIKDATWQLDSLQPVANMIAAIQGGTSAPQAGSKDRNSTSVIGGALGGAVAGGVAGASLGPWGAAGGAVLGAASALFQ